MNSAAQTEGSLGGLNGLDGSPVEMSAGSPVERSAENLALDGSALDDLAEQMSVDLRGRSFLKLLDFSPEEIRYLVALGHEFKRLKHAGVPHRLLEGKNIVLLFEKTSTRTRCSFEVAGHDLGLGVTYLDPHGSQMGTKESIADTARVLGRMFDAIEYRGFAQALVEELAEKSGVPVFNGLTDEFHPTQMIADAMTIEENFPGGLGGLKFAFFGDARNNVSNSLMVMCAKLGMNYYGCAPKELWPNDDLVAQCREIAHERGASIHLTEDVDETARGSHVLYTDIWLSMGENPDLWGERIRLLKPYQVTTRLINMAASDAIFMHCLPSFHDRNTSVGEEVYQKFGISEMEVTNEAFEGARSRVFDEAENRMHSIKAIMYAALR